MLYITVIFNAITFISIKKTIYFINITIYKDTVIITVIIKFIKVFLNL